MAKAKPRPTLTSGQLVCGFTVLAVGLFTAMFFRRDSAGPVAYDAEASSIMQQPVERRIFRRAPGARLVVAQEAPRVDTFRIPTAATGGGVDTNQTPSTPSYRRTLSPVGALLKPVTEATAPAAPSSAATEDHPPAGAPASHTILDGDTLASLAERYLGSSDRGVEIYEYNRDVLTSPDLLPIGKVLQIPPRERSSEVASEAPATTSTEQPVSAPAASEALAKPQAEVTPTSETPPSETPAAELPPATAPLAPVQ